MRTGLGRDRDAVGARCVHLGETRRAADVHDVGAHTLAGTTHAPEQTLDRLYFRGRRSCAAPRQPIHATLLAHFARRPLDHLVALGMHTDERVEPRRHLESDREQAVGHAMKVLDAAFTHECLEPHDAAPGERRQLREVLGNHPAPEAKVDECLPGRDGDLRIEG